jgi:hypothetical protein
MGHLMGQQGLHTNKKTGEVLAQGVQICPMCYKNFSSDDAWEKHYDRKKYPDPSCCQEPTSVGLIPFKNSRGATIYRLGRQGLTDCESNSNVI